MKRLDLGRDLRRTVQLVDMVKRREKLKLAMLDEEMEILKAQMECGEFDASVLKCLQSGMAAPSSTVVKVQFSF